MQAIPIGSGIRQGMYLHVPRGKPSQEPRAGAERPSLGVSAAPLPQSSLARVHQSRMRSWPPRLYRAAGLNKGVPESVIQNALEQADTHHRQHPELPTILTLGHLAWHCDVDYDALHSSLPTATNL